MRPHELSSHSTFHWDVKNENDEEQTMQFTIFFVCVWFNNKILIIPFEKETTTTSHQLDSKQYKILLKCWNKLNLLISLCKVLDDEKNCIIDM